MPMGPYLCDDMLRGLCRWMRAAGHDTALVPARTTDSALINRAKQESRTLVTCDKRLLRERQTLDIEFVLLQTNDPRQAAVELTRRVNFDWLYAPLTRCMVDNTFLRRATAEDMARTPINSLSAAGPVRSCPHCRRVYWRGRHAARIQRQLEAWQDWRQD